LQTFVVAAFIFLALLIGGVTSFFGGDVGVLLAAAMLPLPMIFKDYRAGVVMLTFALVAASSLPNIQGLNLLNFLTVATLGSFLIKAAFQRKNFLKIPGPPIWAFILPTAVGIVIAYPHIHDGVKNYPLLEHSQDIYDPMKYVVERFVKPIFYYFSYVFLLSNAVRESKHPERFIALFAASALVPTALVVYTILTYPGSFMDVSRNREFMAPRGMHANEFGMLLALASGPLLFAIGTFKSRSANFWTMVVFGITSVGVILTFSRGGLLAYLICVGGYLYTRRQLKVLLVIAFLGSVVFLAAPESITDRLTAGIRPGAVSDVQDIEKDELTAGRFGGWVKLFPMVSESPIWGRGIGSTQWSDAVAEGRYAANHPHNIYLEILMDLGLAGVACFAYLFYRYLNRYGRLVKDQTLSTPMRAFLEGSRWAMVGGLVMAFTTAYYMPNQAQFFMWFSLGVMFTYWRRPDYKVAVAPGMRKMFGARRTGGVWGSRSPLVTRVNSNKTL
jgi:O-antigen ligase